MSLVSDAPASERTSGLASLAAAFCSAGPASAELAPTAPSAQAARLRTVTDGSFCSADTSALVPLRSRSMPSVVAASERTATSASDISGAIARPSRRPAIDCNARNAATRTVALSAPSAVVNGTTDSGREMRPSARAMAARASPV